MKLQILILSLLYLSLFPLCMTSFTWFMYITPIDEIDLFKPQIQASAKHAIEHHNKINNDLLQLIKIEKGAWETRLGRDNGPYGLTYYLSLITKNSSGNYKIFQTAVWCIPMLNFYKSVGLNFISEASELFLKLQVAPPDIRKVCSEIMPMAVFVTENHNLKMQSRIELKYVVDCEMYIGSDYSKYFLSLLVYDHLKQKNAIFTSDVTKHEQVDGFMESTGLKYLCEVELSRPTELNTAPLLAEFAVADHNSKEGTEFEFVDTVNVREYNDVYEMSIQVIDKGKHKIFTTEVKGKIGSLESTGLVYVSEALPRLKEVVYGDDTDWISAEIFSKIKDVFTMASLDEHENYKTRQLSAIARELEEGRIKKETIMFLNETNYKFLDDNSLLNMMEELERFIPFVMEAPSLYSYVLPALETLSKVEAHYPRKKAVELLYQVGVRMKGSDLLEWFIPLVKRLAAGKSYAGRISSCTLFDIAYMNATKTLKRELRFLYSKLCHDDQLVVRRFALSNLGNVSVAIVPWLAWFDTDWNSLFVPRLWTA